MNYFTDELTSETSYVDRDQQTEKSDNRPSVSLHRRSPEKPKQKIIIGRRKPYVSSTSLSKSKQNASLSASHGVSKPAAASATPHRGPARFLNVFNGEKSDAQSAAAILAKTATIMKSLAVGKQMSSPNIDKENHRPVPKLANAAVVGEKPSDAGGLTKTPRQTLLSSLDDFSPSPVVRRDPPEGIRSFSPDVSVQQNGLGLEENDEELRQLPRPVLASLVRTSTTAAIHGPAKPATKMTNVPQSQIPQAIHDTPKGSTISTATTEAGKTTTSEVNKEVVAKKKNPVAKDLKKNNKTLNKRKPKKMVDVVDDESILEEETPTFQKTPARFVNKEKRGVKRNKLTDKLEPHEEKEEVEQEDSKTDSGDEEPPPKKASPENTGTNKPYRSLVSRESDVDEWFGPLPPRAAVPPEGSVRARLAQEQVTSLDAGVNSNPKSSLTDANFKKPMLPQPKKKGRTAKNQEANSTDQATGEKRKPEEATEECPRKESEAKSSNKTRVGEKRKAEVPQENLMENRYLTKWVPLLRNKKLYIEGDLMNFDSVLPSELSSKWITSKIVSRISDKRVGTKKTCYVLEGQLAIPEPGERPVPLFVIDKFKDGFPENWQNVIQHWIHFNDQSMVTEAANQTILTNIQSLTMSMFNSTPMPGMMSNINISSMSSIVNSSRALSKIPAVHVSKHKSRSPMKRVTTSAKNQSLVDHPVSPEPICETSKQAKYNSKIDHLVVGTSTDKMEQPSMSKTEKKTANQSTLNNSFANQVHLNKSSTKNTSEIIAPEQSQNQTMSIRDFSKLKLAKSYKNTKMVKSKKFYLCQFCDFKCTAFAMVKKHLKDLHVEEHVDEENNEPNGSQSKSPIKRKVNSNNKSTPAKSYGELIQPVQGQQEISAKQSRFGRNIMKRKNRSSWVDVPSPDVHELEVSKNKKNESARKIREGRSRKRNPSSTEQRDKLQSKQTRSRKDKVNNKSKKAVLGKEVVKPVESVKKVQNPEVGDKRFFLRQSRDDEAVARGTGKEERRSKKQ